MSIANEIRIKTIEVSNIQVTKKIIDQIPSYDGLLALEILLDIDEHSWWNVNILFIGYLNIKVKTKDILLTHLWPFEDIYDQMWERLSFFFNKNTLEKITPEDYVYVLLHHSTYGLSKVAIPLNNELFKYKLRGKLDCIYLIK